MTSPSVTHKASWAGLSRAKMNQQTSLIASCAAAVVPVGSFIVNLNPYITAIAGLLSVSWFLRLWYLSLKDKP